MNPKRKRLIEITLLNTTCEILSKKKFSKYSEHLTSALEDIIIILNHRYLSPHKWCVPVSSDWFLHVLPSYDEARFKATLRVTRAQFKQILDAVAPAPCFNYFQRRNSTELQVAIALYRFGHDGSGCSLTNVAHLFGTSEAGTILMSTNRFITALLRLQNQVIVWPSPVERQQILESMIDCLPGCVGYLDGCHINLFEAPTEDHEAYFSRKQQYGIHVQAICDNDLIFRHVTIGFPASAHDARVYANSNIGSHPEKYLAGGEWIAADSAYKLTNYVVTPFRDNSRVGTLRQRHSFNRHFSSYRVKIEQSFGILKEVFGSLRNLRIRVNKKRGHKKACEWILACVILYNLVRPTAEKKDIDSLIVDEECNEEFHNSCADSFQRERLFNWYTSKKM